MTNLDIIIGTLTVVAGVAFAMDKVRQFRRDKKREDYSEGVDRGRLRLGRFERIDLCRNNRVHPNDDLDREKLLLI